jgi:hypothetical protein
MMFRLIKNKKGQVAIFIALLFQVLFLFFAMVVNVGLLVHHKINLQNSVDLAAYYGAMKQAEVLNAIGHINYQIRQSWKLLTWRQRVLGSAGAGDPNAPYPKFLANSNNLADVLAGGPNLQPQTPYRLPRFCITYAPHELQNGANANENSCREMHTANVVALPNRNVLQIPGFFGFGNLVSSAIGNAIQAIANRCVYVGTANYVYGGRFIASHNFDVDDRQYLINYLATGLSVDQDNFYEIDGGSARDGIEKTISKNLTDANRANLSVRILNGLSQGSCRATGARIGSDALNNNAPSWLVPVEVYPVWRYFDCNQDSNGNPFLGQQARHLSAGNANQPQMFNDPALPVDLRNAYNELQPFLSARPVLTGFEKDPWCMAYVGVKAETRPKIPFMPLSDVTLTAEAYAKPFGGRIGPWYVNRWTPNQQGQNRITDTDNDPAIPGKTELTGNLVSAGSVRVLDVQNIQNVDDPAWAANISRFPGDTLGWASERVLAFFHRVLRTNSVGAGTPYNRLYDGQTLPWTIGADNTVSLRHYQTIGTAPGIAALDQLTWDETAGAAPKQRLAEIAAIAPDLFDMAYYSIDPDFYNNYFTKIEQHRNRRGGFEATKRLLGDLGSRFGASNEMQRFNVFDQIRIQRMVGNPDALNSEVAMPYLTKNPAHLLNSWSADSIIDFSNNTTKFGNCNVPATVSAGNQPYETPLAPATPGNCIYGGRVGYSVKLVGRGHLLDPALELGGQGVSGPIRNPPPANW